MARRYLKALTKGDVKDEIIDAYLQQGPAMLRFLQDESELELSCCDLYADYYPEVEGGLAGGRTIECEGFDGQRLGADRQRLKPPQSLTLMFGEISLTAREAHRLVQGGVKGRWLALQKVLGYLFALPWRRRRGRDRLLTLGQALVSGLWRLMKTKGVEVRFETSVASLVVEKGAVTGAVLKDMRTGECTRVRAKKGVILASGGFSRHEEKKRRYHSTGPTSADWGAAAPEDQGEALDWCALLKPKLALMQEAWWMPVMKVPGEDFARSVVIDRSMPGSLVVDQNGERYVNESAPYENFIAAMRRHPKRTPSFLITDAFHRANYTLGPLLPGVFYPRWLWPRQVKGFIKVADSLRDLALQLKLPPSNLEQTVARFNVHAAKGRDPWFQRGASGYDRYYADPKVGANPCLKPLDKGPFYAVPLWPGDLGSKGGFVVDQYARMVGEDDQVLPGLYAVGNCSANPLGNIYPGAGGTLGPAMTFGYIAAETVMKGVERRQYAQTVADTVRSRHRPLSSQAEREFSV